MISNKLKNTIAILCFLFFSNSCFSQKSNTGNWLIYFGNQKISKKLNWWNEVQSRNYNVVGDVQQILLRTGIGYNLTENNNNILLGYAFIHSQNYLPNKIDKVAVNEHRIYQQFTTKQNFGSLFLQHRYRIEERFLPTDFKLRFRYFLSANIPLNSKKFDKNTFYASAYNEIFINSKTAVFDRNRIYGGIGYVINKNLKIETGYMSQVLEKSNRGQFQIIFFNNMPIFKN